MRILFFGDDVSAVLALQRIVDEGHDVCGVGLRTEPRNPLLAERARALGLAVMQPKRVNAPEFVAEARRLAPELVVSVNYNQIFGPEILAVPTRDAFNVHNGMLPNYRGGGGLYGAVINGETRFGQTAHLITADIDGGAIVVQRELPILPEDTMAELMARAAEAVPDTVALALAAFAKPELEVRPQSADGSYFPKKPDGDEIVDWSEPSDLLLGKIRARNPGPGNVTYVGDRRLTIWKASATAVPRYVGPVGQVIGRRAGGVLVKTGDTAILVKAVQFDNEPVIVPRFPIGTCFLANWRKAYLDLRDALQAFEVRLSRLEDKAGR